MSEDWFKWDGVHTKVDITGLAMGASYTGWALEYKSMFGMERKLHFNPFFCFSYLGESLSPSSPGWGNFFKALGCSNDVKLHVTDSVSLGVGSSADVHFSAVHYSSNREKKEEYLITLLVLSAISDLVVVITRGFYQDKANEGKAKITFYVLQALNEVFILFITRLAVYAKEITITLTNLEAKLANTTSRLKTLAGYDANILDQLHPLISKKRLRAVKKILASCQNDAEKAIHTARKVAKRLAGTNAH